MIGRIVKEAVLCHGNALGRCGIMFITEVFYF